MMKPDTPKFALDNRIMIWARQIDAELNFIREKQKHGGLKAAEMQTTLLTERYAELLDFALRGIKADLAAAPKPDCVGVEDFNVGDLKFALENWGNLDYKSGCEWAHHLLLAYRDEIYKLVEQRDIDDGPELPNASIMGWKKPLIIKAWKKGLSLRDVGEIFDVSHDTVHRITMNLDRLSDDRHVYEPNKRYPFQCEHCGYPEHETLKHTTVKGLLAVKEKAQERGGS